MDRNKSGTIEATDGRKGGALTPLFPRRKGP